MNEPELHLRDLIQINPERRVRFDQELVELVRAPRFSTKSYEWLAIRFRDSAFKMGRCPALAQKLNMTLEQLEHHVIELYSGISGRSRAFNLQLPLEANGDWAFLFGLYYSSGGITQTALRFALEAPVIDYLQTPRMVSSLGQGITKISKGREGRKHGSMEASYGRLMLDILQHFGLKTAESFQLGHGKYVPSRYLALGIPHWISSQEKYMHRFTEGYINGLHSASGLSGRLDPGVPRGIRKGKAIGSPHLQIYMNFKLSVCCYNGEEALQFAETLKHHLESLGIKCFLTRNHNDGRRNVNYQVAFHDLTSLRIFSSKFMVLRTMHRLKIQLRLAANEDYLLNNILRRTRGVDNYVLGMVYNGPKLISQLVEASPKRPYNMTVKALLRPSILKLKKLKVIKQRGQLLIYEPSGFKNSLIFSVEEKLENSRRKIAELSNHLLYVCRACSTLGAEETCDHCGKKREPAPRIELRRFARPSTYRQLNQLLLIECHYCKRRFPTIELRDDHEYNDHNARRCPVCDSQLPRDYWRHCARIFCSQACYHRAMRNGYLVGRHAARLKRAVNLLAA